VTDTRPRCIVDTSTLYGPTNRRAIVAAANEHRIEAYWSPPIIGELYRVLTVRWIQRSGADFMSLAKLSASSKRMMTILTDVFGIVNPKPPYVAWDGPRDPDDNHLYCAATACSADFVVSENTTDFPPMACTKALRTSAQLFERLE
jgi:putative PIN family toxin of toxin-antitoxin system